MTSGLSRYNAANRERAQLGLLPIMATRNWRILMKAVLFTIIGGVVGLIGGTYIRILVTDLVVAPLIVPLVHPSAQTYGDAPIISVVGALIMLTSTVVGGGFGYHLGTKKG